MTLIGTLVVTFTLNPKPETLVVSSMTPWGSPGVGGPGSEARASCRGLSLLFGFPERRRAGFRLGLSGFTV